MADNRKYWYFRMKATFFQEKGIKVLEHKNPVYVLILLKMYCESLDNGCKLSEEYLPVIIGYDEEIIREALKEFEEWKYIERPEKGVIDMSGIKDLVGSSSTEADRQRTYYNKTREDEGYSDNFEEFWKIYPRKDDKGMAYKKYKARLKNGFSPEQLRLAANNYAEMCRRNRTEKQFIKQGKTFLSDTTPFVDFLPKEGEQEKTAEAKTPEELMAKWRVS